MPAGAFRHVKGKTMPTVRAALVRDSDSKVIDLANFNQGQGDPPTQDARWIREAGAVGDIVWAAGQEPVIGQQWDGNNPATFSDVPDTDGSFPTTSQEAWDEIQVKKAEVAAAEAVFARLQGFTG
jgi:hypothetical protein